MIKRFVSIVCAVMLLSCVLSCFAYGEELNGKEFIDSILTGERTGDGTSVEYQNKVSSGNQNKNSGLESYQSGRSSSANPNNGYELLTFEFEGHTLNGEAPKNKDGHDKTRYKYKRVGDGSGPSVVFITGSGVSRSPERDRADVFMERPEFDGYNVLVVTSDSYDVAKYFKGDGKQEELQRVLSSSSELGGKYRKQFGIAVADKYVELFSGSTDCSVVGWSLGGCAAGGTTTALQNKGVRVHSVDLWEGIFYKGGKYIGMSELEKANVPLYCSYVYSGKRLSQNEGSLNYEASKSNPNAQFFNLSGEFRIDKKTLKVDHGTMNEADSVYKRIQEHLPPLKTDDNTGSAKDQLLKKTQASLLDSLNTKKSTSFVNKVKNTAKNVVSSVATALSNFVSGVTKTTNTDSKTKTTTASSTSTKTSGSNTSSSKDTTATKPTSIWNNTMKNITSKLTSPQKLLNAITKVV